MLPSFSTRARIWPALLLISACAEWPTHANLPATTGAAQATNTSSLDSGDTDTGTGTTPTQVDWSTTTPESEDNSTCDLDAATSVPLGGGIRVAGSLSAWGWDHAADPPATEDTGCTPEGEFPGSSPGYYSGDVDWAAVAPAEAGVLCVAVLLEGTTDETYFDVTAWQAGACELPGQGVTDPNSGALLGQSASGTSASWSVDVDSSAALGVLMAGFIPTGDDMSATYDLVVSLVSEEAHASTGCPAHPASR